MTETINERLARLDLMIMSHLTAYNFLFTTIFSSLLAGKSDAEFERARDNMMNTLRFNMTAVPNAVPDALSMQVQANAISYVEWLLGVVDDTRREAQTSKPEKG